MLRRFDLQLLFAATIILILGILIQYSLSSTTISLHLAYIGLGLASAYLASRLDTNFIKSFWPHLYVLALFLLTATLLIGTASRGSTRWLDIGSFRFQPSEFAKLLLTMSLSQFIATTSLTRASGLLKIIAAILIPLVLVFLQPDLGSAIIIAAIGGTMFFASGVRLRHLAAFITIGLIIAPFFWFSLRDYQKARVHTFLDPSSDPLGKGYNSIQSIIAIGSGQISGRGLGHGTQSQLRFLPENRTDFVFASLAEELGLIGALTLILSYTWLILRLFYLTAHTDTPYAYLSIIGIIAMFSSQVVVNTCINLGLLPVTGITLPLVSAGGSSMVISLTALGLVHAYARPPRHQPSFEIS